MPVGASAASQERAEKVTEGFISGGEDGADEDLVDAELILAASATTIHFVVDRHNAALLRRISREHRNEQSMKLCTTLRLRSMQGQPQGVGKKV
jgi:hypothetical protein